MEVAGGETGRVRPRRAWAGSGIGSSARSRSAPGSRPGRWSSATSSAAARRPRSTACSRPGSASPRSTPPTSGRWGTMPALRGTRIELVAAERGGRAAAHRAARGLRGRRRRSSADDGRELAATAAVATSLGSPRAIGMLPRWRLRRRRLRLARLGDPGGRARDRLRQHAAARPRGGRAAATWSAAPGSRSPTPSGRVGELAVRAVYLDDTAGQRRPRALEPGRGRRERPAGGPGLDRDRLPRRLRVGRHAGSRCRSPTRPACSRSPRRAPRSTSCSRSSAPATRSPRTSSRPASAPSAG